MTPSVSVVIGTHNHAHFLPECLDSVKAQTFSDFEVIVVDNGSTDNTRAVIEKYNWDKIRYFYQENTGSIAGSRNTGIRLAQGDLVAFLDSDDLWRDQKLAKTIQVFRNNKEVAIVSHHVFVRKDGESIGIAKVGPAHKDMFKRLLFLGNCLAGSATTVKKDVLVEVGGFDESKKFINAEDYDLWLKIAYAGEKFYFIDECLGEYRIHGSNASLDSLLCSHNTIFLVKKYFKEYKHKGLMDYVIYGLTLGVIYFRLGCQYYAAKRYRQSAINILKSFIYSPSLLHIVRFVFKAILSKLKSNNIFNKMEK